MTMEILMGALGFITLMIGVVRPLLELNKNITEMTAAVKQLNAVISELKDRVKVHGSEIDKINVVLENHEVRITTLEK